MFRLASEFYTKLWAIESAAFYALVEQSDAWIDRLLAICDPKALAAAPGAGPPEDFLNRILGKEDKMTIVNGVARIPIKGAVARGIPPLVRRVSNMCDVEVVQADVQRAVASEGARVLAYDIDCPGGVIDGIEETARLIAEASQLKTSLAFVGGFGTSAGYWLTSAVPFGNLFAAPEATLGSIGTFMTMVDSSQAHQASGHVPVIITNTTGTFKASGAHGVAMSAAEIGQLQNFVNAQFQPFGQFVIAQRKPHASFLRGQRIEARTALGARLIDRVTLPREALAIAQGLAAAR